MYVYILIVINSLLGTISTILTKYFQLSLKANTPHIISYNFFNALFACIYFFILNGFRFEINFKTAVYAFFFAGIVITGLISLILSYAVMSISPVGIITTCGTIILPTLFGIFYFKEPVTVKIVLSIILLIVSIIFPVIRGVKITSFKKSVLPCILCFASSGFSVIISKMYAIDKNVCSPNSFFLFTNLIILVLCATCFFVFLLKNHQKKINCFISEFSLPVKSIGNIALVTLLSNASSLLTIFILASINISLYTMLNLAGSLILITLTSSILLHEKQSPANWVALVIAIISICLNYI